MIHTPNTASRTLNRVFRLKDTEKKIEATTRHEAIVRFETAKRRLNDINNWTLLCGNSPAEFHLTDFEGNSIDSSEPASGNIIKVRFHAPQVGNIQTYSYYKITGFISEKNLLKDTEEFGFNTEEVNVTKIEDFVPLKCIFMVSRQGSFVSVLEMETKKFPHKQANGSAISTLQNKLSSLMVYLNPQKHQWKSLVNGVLQ